jgi:hypothetical protein
VVNAGVAAPLSLPEAITGGITGSLNHPDVLILGRYEPVTGRLRVVGRTSPVPAARPIG